MPLCLANYTTARPPTPTPTPTPHVGYNQRQTPVKNTPTAPATRQGAFYNPHGPYPLTPPSAHLSGPHTSANSCIASSLRPASRCSSLSRTLSSTPRLLGWLSREPGWAVGPKPEVATEVAEGEGVADRTKVCRKRRMGWAPGGGQEGQGKGAGEVGQEGAKRGERG